MAIANSASSASQHRVAHLPNPARPFPLAIVLPRWPAHAVDAAAERVPRPTARHLSTRGRPGCARCRGGRPSRGLRSARCPGKRIGECRESSISWISGFRRQSCASRGIVKPTSPPGLQSIGDAGGKAERRTSVIAETIANRRDAGGSWSGNNRAVPCVNTGHALRGCRVTAKAGTGSCHKATAGITAVGSPASFCAGLGRTGVLPDRAAELRRSAATLTLHADAGATLVIALAVSLPSAAALGGHLEAATKWSEHSGKCAGGEPPQQPPPRGHAAGERLGHHIETLSVHPQPLRRVRSVRKVNPASSGPAGAHRQSCSIDELSLVEPTEQICWEGSGSRGRSPIPDVAPGLNRRRPDFRLGGPICASGWPLSPSLLARSTYVRLQ